MRYLPVKIGTDFVFQKNNFKNLNKLQSIVNIFVFFIWKRIKESNPTFLNNTHFSSTPPFLGKTFHPHPYCQIRGSQFPLYKRRGEGGFELCQCGTRERNVLLDLFIAYKREINKELNTIRQGLFWNYVNWNLLNHLWFEYFFTCSLLKGQPF